jgi:hypothetical protein
LANAAAKEKKVTKGINSNKPNKGKLATSTTRGTTKSITNNKSNLTKLISMLSVIVLDFEKSTTSQSPTNSSINPSNLPIAPAFLTSPTAAHNQLGADIETRPIPFYVSIKSGDDYCGGTYINYHYVLTSATCLYE